MADSCCPGNATAVPAVPTISIGSNGSSFQNGICLPSSCQSRTWQLATCQETRQSPHSAQVAVSLLLADLSAFQQLLVWVLFANPFAAVNLALPSCSEFTVYQANCCEVGPSRQSSCQTLVFMSGSYQAACGQSACCDTMACQPSCSEVTSCHETSCPPTVCEASLCQPNCCRPGACQPPSGEDQACKLTYYHPICYIFKTHQSCPCVPVFCQPLTCAFSSCDAMCCVSSPCPPLHCQLASSKFIICHPVANCQPPCSVKNPCKLASWGTILSALPACGGTTSCN
ncbi:hypothetical protein MC885_000548 [Smutsia gigantea]|nr:hypothetical protein MC885_000548 [Smutsia gigantea]